MDKDEGITSFGVVRQVRRLLGGTRAGHAGALDPFATGLLPVLTGRATRLVRFVARGAKRYRAFVRFGQATDTDDCTGRPLGPPAALPDEAALIAALPAFVGEIEQRPPAYSAKRIGGHRAYRLARAGEPVRLAPVPVRVESLRLLGFDGRTAEIACRVGPGTYIRALARDLGERLGGAAHLSALRRTAVGPFRVDQAKRLDALGDPGALRSRLLDPLTALSGLPRLEVSRPAALALGHGRPVPFRPEEEPPGPDGDAEADCRAVVTAGEAGAGARLLAVVRPGRRGWHPVVVWTLPAPPARARDGRRLC